MPATGRESIAAAFRAEIARLTALSDEVVQWPKGRLRLSNYVSNVTVPEVLVTSVRAVVLKGQDIVLVRTRDGYAHVTPGGRREAGETLEETLRRGVLEECGWTLGRVRQFGFQFFEHLDDMPIAELPIPHREFVNLLYVAEGDRHLPERMDLSQIEESAELVSISDASAAILPGQRAILAAALETMLK